MGVAFCQRFLSASNEMTTWFCSFEFVYIMDYVDGFPYIKPSLHPWNKTYMVRMDDCFNVFLDSVSENKATFSNRLSSVSAFPSRSIPDSGLLANIV